MHRTELKFLAPFLILSAWVGIIYAWTDGLSAFTVFSKTEKAAGPLPRPFPAIVFFDHTGKKHTIQDLQGQYVIAEFMYLSCPNVCGIVRSRLMDLKKPLTHEFGDRLHFLSISFDPERDTLPVLDALQDGLGLQSNWTLAALPKEDLPAALSKLRTFGVAISRRPDTTFAHPGRLYLLDKNGLLISIINPAKSIKENMKNIRMYIH